MRSVRRLASSWISLAIFVVLCWLLMPPTHAQAQTQGNNAVYSGTNTLTGSSAFIDASVFSGTDICAKIYSVLTTNYPLFGAVVDARGISTPSTCQNSPWGQPSNAYANVPSVILLPAGVITINSTWKLPDHTRIIGEGAGAPNSSGPPITGTVLAAGSSFSPMIQFGDLSNTICNDGANAGICYGISVENLALDGAGQNITGIFNEHSEERSYVKQVTLNRITGTGLHIGGPQSQNSGPYSNITFVAGSMATSSTVCAEIAADSSGQPPLPLRGIHGLSCTGNSVANSVAVYLDTISTTIEDVHIDGFYDGILVGANHSARSDVLFNITGGANVTNLIHICGSRTAINCPATAKTVTDISVLGVASSAGNTIDDDVTSTTLTNSTDQYVGMYVLGEQVGNGYSRFSTSPRFPTWIIGSNAITGNPSCVTGSLYSKTTGTTGTTLWGCVQSAWTAIR